MSTSSDEHPKLFLSRSDCISHIMPIQLDSLARLYASEEDGLAKLQSLEPSIQSPFLDMTIIGIESDRTLYLLDNSKLKLKNDLFSYRQKPQKTWTFVRKTPTTSIHELQIRFSLFDLIDPYVPYRGIMCGGLVDGPVKVALSVRICELAARIDDKASRTTAECFGKLVWGVLKWMGIV